MNFEVNKKAGQVLVPIIWYNHMLQNVYTRKYQELYYDILARIIFNRYMIIKATLTGLFSRYIYTNNV